MLTFLSGTTRLDILFAMHQCAKYSSNPKAGNNAWTSKLKMKAMYTYLFGSSDLEYKRTLTNDTAIHHRSGPSAWKLITEHAIKGDNQAIRRAENMIHTMTLNQFGHDVKLLLQSVINNRKILQSSGISDSSIASNLFRVLRESHNEEFNAFIGRKQDIYDEGTPFDFETFTKATMQKYNALLADKKWKTKPIRNDHMVALEAKVTNLEAQLASARATKSADSSNKRQKQLDNMPDWKKIPPKAGQPQTIERRGRSFHWCQNHGYWNASHSTANCRMGKSQNKNSTDNRPTLSLNVADLPNTDIQDLDICLACTPDINTALDELTNNDPIKD